MVRKLLPVIICVIVLIVVLVGVNVIKAKWSADEAIAFNEGEGAIIAADLVESSNISNIEVGTGAAPVVKADDVKADTSFIMDAVGKRGSDDFSTRLFDAMQVPGKDKLDTSVVLMSYDGTERRYVVTAVGDGIGRMAFVGKTGDTWVLYEVRSVEGVSSDGSKKQ